MLAFSPFRHISEKTNCHGEYLFPSTVSVTHSKVSVAEQSSSGEQGMQTLAEHPYSPFDDSQASSLCDGDSRIQDSLPLWANLWKCSHRSILSCASLISKALLKTLSLQLTLTVVSM